MDKKNLFLLLVILLGVTWGQSQATINFRDMTVAGLREQAEKEAKLYLVYLRAEWVVPCKWMEENSFDTPRIIHYTNQNFLALQLDINKKNGKYYQKKWEIPTLPALLIFNPQGVEISRAEGSMDEEELFDFLKVANQKWQQKKTASSTSPNDKIMDSPKATLTLSRPALIPDEATRKPVKQPKKQTVPADNRQHFAQVPSQVKKQRIFTPRSGQEFTVLLGLYDDYNKALSLEKKCSGKYGKRVTLISNSDGKNTRYQVIIGRFSQRSEAIRFLKYLNRNGVMGQVVEGVMD